MNNANVIKRLEHDIRVGTTSAIVWEETFYLSDFSSLERTYNTVQGKLKELKLDKDSVFVDTYLEGNEVRIGIEKLRPFNATEIAALQEQIATLQKADEEYEAFQKWKKEIGL